jgi:hypothetical protein
LFIIYSICGLLAYAVLFLVFFCDDFAKRNTGKKQFVFAAAFAVLGVFVIMFKANWTFSSDHLYAITLANKYYPLDIYPSLGRFFPLGHSHYNLPFFVMKLLGIKSGRPVELYYASVVPCFVIALLCLYALCNKIWLYGNGRPSFFPVFFACTSFVLALPFTQVFMNLIYPETPLIALFSFFALMYYRALVTDKRRYYAAAFCAAVYATYCKEPVFGVFGIVAMVNHLFRFKNESKREKFFYMALIINGILFVCLYYFLVFTKVTRFYNEGRADDGRLRLMLGVLRGEPILALMFLFGFFRLFCIIVKKDRQHLFFDSLLLAGLGYVAAYVLLRLNAGYYLVPAVVLFAPSLIYWFKQLFQMFEKKNIQGLCRLCLFFVFLFVFTFGFGASSARIERTWRERHEFMPYMNSLFSEHKNGKEFIWYESDITGFAIAVRGWRKIIENVF